MRHSEITKEQLQKIAVGLGGGWRYHSILTDKRSYRGHYLSNGAGLIINVCNGDDIPQWTLQFRHPKHDHLQNVLSIGCSISKPLDSIVGDLRSRLLSRVTLAYEKLEALTVEAQKSKKKVEHERHFLDAMNRVFYINDTYDHRYSSSFRIENEEGVRFATMRKSHNMEKLKLEIDDVTPEQIFQIMQIVAPQIFKK
ncbi:hypothetical protein OAA_13795 [Vibrio cyclitrophicus 1F175]|uniref:hypothetical protein n=1 Tax=Vibrio cyclitrophicus TaxID=47951 RepID=UPI00030F02DE|nr:hypothetical protein [Vibrio cyclitrophicus]OEF63554.1 hypothetical protein OAA_13795 [Vibrio cyclitrophicus 1F175]